MSEVFSFTTENRSALLERLSGGERPARLRIVLHGPSRELSPEVQIRVCSGRLVEITVPDLPAPRVFLRLALARTGRIELLPDDGPMPELGGLAPIRRLLLDAEQTARALESLLEPVGGLRAVVVTRSHRVMRAAAQLSRPGLEVANYLIDVPHSISEVLNRFAQDDFLTARSLDQLRDLGVLEIVRLEAVEPAALPSQAPAAGLRSDRVPLRRSIPPARIGRDSRRPSRRPEILETPPLAEDLDERASGSRAPGRSLEADLLALPERTSQAPSRGAYVPDLVETRTSLRPRPSDIDEPQAPPSRPRSLDAEEPTMPSRARRPMVDDDPDLESLGIKSGASTQVLIGVGVVLVLLLLWWLRPTKDAEVALPLPAPDPTPPPVARTTTVAKPRPIPTVSTPAEPGYSLSRPPPLAGPDADRRLREAEALIQAGRYDEADAILSELRKSRPGEALVWLLTAHLETERGRYGEAIKAVDKALAIEPKNYRAHVIKGSILQFEGQPKGAVRSYRTALSISPGHVMSPELRGVTERLEEQAD